MSGRGLPVLNEPILSLKEQHQEETREKWEREWREGSIDPTQTALGRERLMRTGEILSRLDYSRVVDLGCGNGALHSFLKGRDVTAVDIAENALNLCRSDVKRVRRTLPYCKLPEESFDLVLLTDVIAEIEPHLYRLLLSECAALLVKEGYFLCSTPLDFHTENPLGHFLALIRTEFEVIEIKKSYHRIRFFERLSRLLWGDYGASHVIVLCKRKGVSI